VLKYVGKKRDARQTCATFGKDATSFLAPLQACFKFLAQLFCLPKTENYITETQTILLMQLFLLLLLLLVLFLV